MDKPQIKKIVKMDFTPYAKMTPEDVDSQMTRRSDFMRLDDVTYCKEVCVQGERRYVLCFNTQLFKDQRKAREEQLVKVETSVKAENEMLRLAKKDRTEVATKKKFIAHIRKAKLQNFVSIKLKEFPILAKESATSIRSYEGTLLINKKKKIEAGEMDGFWLLVTNQFEKSGEDFIQDTRTVVQPYRDKVIIESSFRDIKSFVDVGPVHVWKAEHVKAHYTICVLAHLMNRTLSLRLQEQGGQKTEGIISPERLYTELSGCHLNRVKVGAEDTLCSLTQPTEKQKELLERLDMKHLIGDTTLKTLSDTALTMNYV